MRMYQRATRSKRVHPHGKFNSHKIKTPIPRQIKTRAILPSAKDNGNALPTLIRANRLIFTPLHCEGCSLCIIPPSLSEHLFCESSALSGR